MLFNSAEFLIFYPVVTLLYFLLPHKYRWLHLLAASCIFYTAFIPVYLLIIVFTIIIDYTAGILIENSEGKRRKYFLIISILANVGVLAIFKYYDFFVENINSLLKSAGLPLPQLPYWNIILPLGLSFHTFQAMSYTIEVYRGNQKAERHFGIYSLYVLFYPQLVAGPIERPQNLIHQFRERHHFDSSQFFSGLRLMLWGFFKKLVIADRLAVYVNAVYAEPGQYHALNLMIATVFFAIQIYCDFSGYSDIAIGAARTMGYKLMINFRRPYFARNIKEFWDRWHISLSTWFRDYIYIPLSGNRAKPLRIYFNVALVFTLSGFWHGASWTFVICGALHATFIILYLIISKSKLIRFKIPDAAAIIFTFSIVLITWIFFRAKSVGDAFLIVKNIFSYDNTHSFKFLVKDARGIEFGITSTLIIFFSSAVMLYMEKMTLPDLSNFDKRNLRDVAFCTFVLSLVITLGMFHQTGFIYFQF